MKKVLLFVAVVTAASFASCKKDRVCTCTTTYTGGISAGTPQTTTYTESKKSAARANCLSTTSTSGTITATKTCTLD